MKLAFSKPTCDADEQRLLFEHFRPTGFEGLQLKHGQYAAYLDAPARFTDEWGHLPGVASALITGGGLDEGSIASLRRILRFGSTVGSDLVILCVTGSREGLTRHDLARAAGLLGDVVTMGKSARLVKLSNILPWGRGTVGSSVVALAQELGVSRRTVYRYLDDLCESGLPVGRDERGYFLSGAAPRAASLTCAEVSALAEAVTAACQAGLASDPAAARFWVSWQCCAASAI